MVQINKLLMSASTATGVSASICVEDYISNYSLYVNATSVSSGGTVKLEGSADETYWTELASAAFTANATYVINSTKVARYIRGNLSNRSDGTVTVRVVVEGGRN